MGAQKAVDHLDDQYEDIGYFPKCLNKCKNLDNMLFVNAWDPWSFAGNGNEYDNSLDGHIGRHTMVALLCSPLSNHHMVYKNIE